MGCDHVSQSLLKRVGWAAVTLMLAVGPAGAQSASAGSGQYEIFVGSELERYLRVLQLPGQTELYP